jgi:hypothetical protein
MTIPIITNIKLTKLTTQLCSKKTIVLQDATIESVLYVHHKKPIGIFIDELYNAKMANKK